MGWLVPLRPKRKPTPKMRVPASPVEWPIVTENIKAKERRQRKVVTNYFTDVLMEELKRRDFVVLAKQEYEALTGEDFNHILDRTDIPL